MLTRLSGGSPLRNTILRAHRCPAQTPSNGSLSGKASRICCRRFGLSHRGDPRTTRANQHSARDRRGGLNGEADVVSPGDLLRLYALRKPERCSLGQGKARMGTPGGLPRRLPPLRLGLRSRPPLPQRRVPATSLSDGGLTRRTLNGFMKKPSTADFSSNAGTRSPKSTMNGRSGYRRVMNPGGMPR